MTETSGNLALKKESASKLALPAIRTRFSSDGNARCIVVLRQERQFNSINLHLYHYAGNNPVKYTDPNGKSDKESERMNIVFSKILSYVSSYTTKEQPNTVSGPADLYWEEGAVSSEGRAYLLSISKGGACTAGAIQLRNLYKDNSIPVNGWAIDLRNGDDITFYKDSDGKNITDRNSLFDKLKVGDLLIYANSENPDSEKGNGWTGHTATIIEKGDDFITTVEFHEDGNPPTVQKLRKDTLQWYNDTELLGGASWN